jgi:hypothetical protein
VHIHDPFVYPPGSSGFWKGELAAVYFAIALVLMLVGPGRFSVDACLFGPKGLTDADRVPPPTPR